MHDRAGVEARPHQSTPKAAAARRPEASPSSWKPKPCHAPAKAVRPRLRRGQLGLGAQRLEGVERMLVRDPADHALLVDLVRAVQRHAVVLVGVEPLQAVEVVRDRRVPVRRRHSRRAGSSTRRALPRRGSSRSSVWSTVSLVVDRKAESTRRSSSVGSASSGSAWSPCTASTTPSKARAVAVGGAELDPVVATGDRPHRQAQVQHRTRALEQRLHVGAAAADDRAPALAPEAEHAVVVEEAERVAGREVERRAGAARPDRRGQRDEEVVAKLRRVAVLGHVGAERLLARTLDRAARLAQEADDLADEPQRRVAERASPRVLEPVPPTADRERHLGRAACGSRARRRA